LLTLGQAPNIQWYNKHSISIFLYIILPQEGRANKQISDLQIVLNAVMERKKVK
jgi:hypothetical protein